MTPHSEISTEHQGRVQWVLHRWSDWTSWLIFSILVIPSMMLSRPGWVAADTKIYLYLDPWRLLVSAQSMWNPNIDMGGVTHQNIGYLFPMGPFFWFVQAVGIPMWVGERLWTSALFLLAAGGVLYVGRLLGLNAIGRFVGALLYMLSPFVLDYMGRSSALLMPWAGFGWMVGFTILAVRKGGWRYPALFALVVATVGGINATAIIMAAPGPILWVLYVGIIKEAPWKEIWRASYRIALLSLFVSTWWLSGLWAESAYGLNILKYTETIPTVTMTSSPAEVFRGLGYWYFYGWDTIQPWVLSASQYIAHVFPILISFAIPAAALGASFLLRWKYRAFAISLIVVGLVTAVGAFPLNLPTPFGAVLKVADTTTVGLAMRSTNRVVPVLLLGLGLLLGAGLMTLIAKKFWLGLTAGGIVVILILVNMWPLFSGQMVPKNLSYPTPIPSYVGKTANYLNAKSPSTRVLGIPGVAFGYYNWGVTMDQVWPGLLQRGWISQAAVPQGELASADLLRSLDESMENGVFDPATLAPMASLMSAGDVLYQGNLQYVRFNSAHQMVLWNQLQPTPKGLGTPKTFGPSVGAKTLIGTLNDNMQLSVTKDSKPVPSLAVFPVKRPRSAIRTEAQTTPLLVAGDGQGLLEAAAFNLFGTKTPIFYSASFPSSSSFSSVNSPHSTLVVTDSNKKRLDSWGTIDSNYGYVQTAHEQLLVPNPSQQPSTIFADTNPSTQTVAVLQGVKSVEATSYGNPISNSPEAQPFNAVDGNPATAWEEGALEPATNQTIQITLNKPETTNHVTLVQTKGKNQDRLITTATLRFNGGSPTPIVMNKASQSEPGQVITFPRRTFQTLDITITGVTGSKIRLASLSGVGFSEIKIGNVPPATEWLRMPTDLLNKVGTNSASHPLYLLMGRLRASGLGIASDPELQMRRMVDIPTQRSFQVKGEARIDPLVGDATLNQIVGRTTSSTYPRGSAGADPIVQSDSSTRLAGDLNASSWAAEDGNSSTAWQSNFAPQSGQWLQFSLAHPLTFDHLNLQVIEDGRHDVPTSVTVSAGGQSRVVTLPGATLGKGRPQGSTTTIPVSFPALSGSTVRLTVNTALSLSLHQITLDGGLGAPVGIAELGLPGVVEPVTPTAVPSTCPMNLLTVNNLMIPVALSGSTTDALNRGAMSISQCTNSGSGIPFAKGMNKVTTDNGSIVGWDVDLLGFSSAPVDPPPAVHVVATPTIKVSGSTQWTTSTKVTGTGSSSWLILGQSQSDGWTATVNGKSLGKSVLMDGYANGWKLPAIASGTTATVDFVWTPQHVINYAEIVSLIGFMLVLFLMFWPRRKKGTRVLPDGSSPTWASPFTYDRPARSWKTTMIASLAIGFVVGFFTAPLIGLLCLGVSIAALRFKRTRVVLFVGSVAALCLAGFLTAYLQHKYIFPWALGWPDNFGRADTCAWLALALIMVDGAVESLRQRWRSEAADADPQRDHNESQASLT